MAIRLISLIEKVRLEYSPNNGTSFRLIADNVPNIGSYEWQVPSCIVSGCIVGVSKVDKKRMMPNKLSYELKFKISGDESLNTNDLRGGAPAGCRIFVRKSGYSS